MVHRRQTRPRSWRRIRLQRNMTKRSHKKRTHKRFIDIHAIRWKTYGSTAIAMWFIWVVLVVIAWQCYTRRLPKQDGNKRDLRAMLDNGYFDCDHDLQGCIW